jgi:hypothetical protein
MAKHADVTLLRHHLEHSVPMNPKVQKRYVSLYTIPFWLYLVTAIQKVSPTVGSLIFIWTLCLEFYGLSRFGIQLLAYGSVAQSIRTYDRWRLDYLRKYDTKLAKLLNTNQGMLVYDNYNHQYGNARLDLERKEQMTLANYTVGAMTRYVYPLDLKLRNGEDGKVLYSLPLEKEELQTFLPRFIHRLTSEFRTLKEKHNKPYNYFLSSKQARERKQYIPIAQVPSPTRDTEDPLDRNDKGLKNFYPWFVSKYNSAQNAGHTNLMLTLLATCRNILALGLYPFVRMDITLYMQWLRVGSIFHGFQITI